MSTADRESLEDLIREIGVARFHGRMASGFIDAELGREVMRQFIDSCAIPVGHRRGDGERKGVVRRLVEKLRGGGARKT